MQLDNVHEQDKFCVEAQTSSFAGDIYSATARTTQEYKSSQSIAEECRTKHNQNVEYVVYLSSLYRLQSFHHVFQQIAFKNLVQRNRQTEQQANRPPPPNSIIHLPFIIVNTSKKTVIDCSISNDK